MNNAIASWCAPAADEENFQVDMSALVLANLATATAALLPPLARGRAAAPPSRCAALSPVRAPPPRLQLLPPK